MSQNVSERSVQNSSLFVKSVMANWFKINFNPNKLQLNGPMLSFNSFFGNAWLTLTTPTLEPWKKYLKACVTSFLLHESETYPKTCHKLKDVTMIDQKHSTEDLRRRIHVHHIEDVLRCNRLRLFAHLYRQETPWALM